jgi:hypothetical protein
MPRLSFLAVAIATGCAAPGDLVFSTELVDFGPALPGVERYERIDIFNRGTGTIALKEAKSTNPNFSIVFPPGMQLSSHQSAIVTVRHLPPADATAPEEADLHLWAAGEIVASLHSKSVPTTPDCALPELLDFGALPIAETGTLELSLQNSTTQASGALIERPYSTHIAFQLNAGWVPLQPGEEVRVPIHFTPGDVRSYTAALPIQRHPLCPVQLMRLLGEGVAISFEVQPGSLGWRVPLGQTEVQAVTLINRRTRPITLSNVQAREETFGDSFHATRFPVRIPSAQRDVSNQLIPGQATIEVSFTPPDLSQRRGVLSIETDLPSEPALVVHLTGSGL